jgi:hypothetical protein
MARDNKHLEMTGKYSWQVMPAIKQVRHEISKNLSEKSGTKQRSKQSYKCNSNVLSLELGVLYEQAKTITKDQISQALPEREK